MFSFLCFTFIIHLLLIIESNANEAPKLLSSNKPLIHQTEGSKFRVFCSVEKGSTPLFFQWSKNDQILSSKPEVNYKIEISDEISMFMISNVSRTDAGNYSCIVRNAFGTDSQIVSLNVRVPPKWVKEPNDIRVNTGDDITIECSADGLPKPIIRWISSKGLIIESESLILQKFTTTSVDTYECNADNGIGEALRKVITIYFSGKKVIACQLKSKNTAE